MQSVAAIYKMMLTRSEKLYLEMYASEVSNMKGVGVSYNFLNFIYANELESVCPNLVILQRLFFFIISVAVASSESNFSKLRLISCFRRNSLIDDRLTNLAVTPSENKFVGQVQPRSIPKLLLKKMRQQRSLDFFVVAE